MSGGPVWPMAMFSSLDIAFLNYPKSIRSRLRHDAPIPLTRSQAFNRRRSSTQIAEVLTKCLEIGAQDIARSGSSNDLMTVQVNGLDIPDHGTRGELHLRGSKWVVDYLGTEPYGSIETEHENCGLSPV